MNFVAHSAPIYWALRLSKILGISKEYSSFDLEINLKLDNSPQRA